MEKIVYFCIRFEKIHYLKKMKRITLEHMKRVIHGLMFSAILVISLVACRLNPPPDPDYVGELNSLLPLLQSSTAEFNGSEVGRYQLIWMQQLAGYRNDDLEIDTYKMNPRHTQDAWNNFYVSKNMLMPRIISMFFSADKIEAKAFLGIARVLAGLNIGFMTDTFGDIPREKAVGYSQGFSSIEYDAQIKVYEFVIDQLSKAVLDLNAAASAPDSLKPKGSDKMYNGNLNSWVKAANVLKARYLLRLAHKYNDYIMVKNHLALATLMTGNQDDLKYSYSESGRNPYYRSVTLDQNARVGKFLADRMNAVNDPRLPVFLKRSTLDLTYFGSAPGQASVHASYIGAPMSSMYSPTYLVTFVEQKFIEAEVHLRTGQQGLADVAFQQAVKASLQKHGVSNATWESQHASITNVTLEQIINAKYIALFLNPEVWTDYRRTGFPAIAPYVAPSGTGSNPAPAIPRRFLYPHTEISNNANNVPQNVTVFTRMWWDLL